MSSRPYHRFVFDQERRTFVGDFEGMYAAEAVEGFSAWSQDDLTHITKRLALTLLEEVPYSSVLDLGCGRGAFTHLLSLRCPDVVGLDVSPTAVERASAAYPRVTFAVHDLAENPSLPRSADLVVALEVLSYLPNWTLVLESVAAACRWLVLSLYLPADPIGFISSHDHLLHALEASFLLRRKLFVDDETLVVLAQPMEQA